MQRNQEAFVSLQRVFVFIIPNRERRLIVNQRENQKRNQRPNPDLDPGPLDAKPQRG